MFQLLDQLITHSLYYEWDNVEISQRKDENIKRERSMEKITRLLFQMNQREIQVGIQGIQKMFVINFKQFVRPDRVTYFIYCRNNFVQSVMIKLFVLINLDKIYLIVIIKQQYLK
ncbi:unnamed protein product [Paramecium sonneborni]|uniref:Uncharacterized protein n=1 Tax=Paramecium sonneborni TaxID=65129 RepID=A0A8S1R656_9CILI|nr:unnamed protein product [Paramecium sonneborni]